MFVLSCAACDMSGGCSKEQQQGGMFRSGLLVAQETWNCAGCLGSMKSMDDAARRPSQSTTFLTITGATGVLLTRCALILPRWLSAQRLCQDALGTTADDITAWVCCLMFLSTARSGASPNKLCWPAFATTSCL